MSAAPAAGIVSAAPAAGNVPAGTEPAIAPAALAQLAVAVVLLGASWPVTKLALLDGAAPSWFACGRAALSMLVGFALLGLTRRLRWPGRPDLPALAALGLLQLGGFFALAHAAVAWVPAGRTAILSNATLVWTVPITVLVMRETISPRRWLAAALSAAGVAVLIGPWAIDWHSGDVLLGHGFLMAAALSWAMAMTIVRRWPPRLSMLQLLPWAFALATLVLLPLAAAHGPGQWSPVSLGCLGLIGLLMGPAGTWCIAQATTALPLVVASVGFLAGPAVGLLVSVIWLGEPMTPSIGLGAALLLVSAGLAATGGRA
ncbi:MAG: DMT family transporter [Janthinobacterium lividum]